MKVQDLLTGPNTWCQGSFRTSDGRMCLAEAMCKVYSNDVWERLYRHINKMHFPYCGISGFNDHESTRFEDIQRVIKELDL